jgi:hypothetical protein
VSPERGERIEKNERGEKGERGGRSERNERVGRSERGERRERGERGVTVGLAGGRRWGTGVLIATASSISLSMTFVES